MFLWWNNMNCKNHGFDYLITQKNDSDINVKWKKGRKHCKYVSQSLVLNYVCIYRLYRKTSKC